MSDAELPLWAEDLRGQVLALEERVGKLEAPRETAAPPRAAVEPLGLERDMPPVSLEDDTEFERKREALQELEAQLQDAEARLSETQTQAESAAQQLAAAQAAARQIADDARRVGEERAALADHAAAIHAGADRLDQTRRVIEGIWPRFLLGGPFITWKERIERALLQESPPASAAMLFASLHAYTACRLEGDQKYLRDALREISRFLYAWIKEAGADERTAYQVALEWAGALNAECVSKCEIEVPEPGAPANNQWMTFPPRGGSSPDVATVRTWCVRDAQKRVIHRAEVFA